MIWSRGWDELRVGDAFETGARRVTEADVGMFAALTGDRHPQHVDAEWAAGSAFGERIAHGMLVVSLAVGLVPFDPERVVALRRLSDVVFKRPLRLGDAVSVDGRVEALRALDDHAGLVTWRWGVRDGQGRLVVRASVEVLWRRDASGHSEVIATEDGSVLIPL